MTDHRHTILGVASDEAVAREWALVLLARGLSPHIHRTLEGFVVSVPSAEGAQALAELAAYAQENPPEAAPSAPPPTVTPVQMLAGALVGFALFEFFAVTVIWPRVFPWMQRGSAEASRILAGEWWRSITALTLHANLPHALGNAVAMAIFFGALCGQVGVGIAGGLVVLAGASGNLVNALLHGAPHNSVGASTAVFGAVGILGSLTVLQRRHSPGHKNRAWMAAAAALALLGLLGTGSERVDVVAHVSGFLVGSMLGLLAALVCPAPPGPLLQGLGGGLAVGALVYCWMRALA